MHRPTRSKVLRLAALSVLLTANGCALLPVAALGVAGNVADIGSAAFSAGTEVFNAGKLESFEFCSFEQGQDAVRSMLNDLRLHSTKSEFEKNKAYYLWEDETGATVDITVRERSAAVCGFRIDVGYFGSEAYARLLLKSIRARLPLVQARPTTQPINPVDLNAPRTYRPTTPADDSDR